MMHLLLGTWLVLSCGHERSIWCSSTSVASIRTISARTRAVICVGTVWVCVILLLTVVRRSVCVHVVIVAACMVHRTYGRLPKVRRWTPEHRTKAYGRVMSLWHSDTFHEWTREHVLHGRLWVPRCWLEVRCHTRAVQLKVIVVLVCV